MSCRLCGGDNNNYRCSFCDARYAEDMTSGNYPDPFKEAGTKPTREEWEECKLAGQREAKLHRFSFLESFKKESDRMARICLEERRLKAIENAKTPEQRAAEEEARKKKKFRERYPY